MTNIIPEITDPLGLNWCQPPTKLILIDDTIAMMERATFASLADYSASIPTGVYEGKMWKRHDGIYDKNCSEPIWLLMWYGPSSDVSKCSINSRRIVLI